MIKISSQRRALYQKNFVYSRDDNDILVTSTEFALVLGLKGKESLKK